MLDLGDRPKPTLGETAKRIIKDVPTLIVLERPAGKSTFQFNHTLEGAFVSTSHRLQLREARIRSMYDESQAPLVDHIVATDRNPYQDIKLHAVYPEFPEINSCWNSPADNTEVQTIQAQATGILAEGETWEDFLNRDSLVVVDTIGKFNAIDADGQDRMCGMQLILPDQYSPSGRSVQYAGQPYNIRTNTSYPDVTAIVCFTKARTNIPLEDLVKNGRATMHISLRVPTSQFLPQPAKT